MKTLPIKFLALLAIALPASSYAQTPAPEQPPAPATAAPSPKGDHAGPRHWRRDGGEVWRGGGDRRGRDFGPDREESRYDRDGREPGEDWGRDDRGSREDWGRDEERGFDDRFDRGDREEGWDRPHRGYYDEERPEGWRHWHGGWRHHHHHHYGFGRDERGYGEERRGEFERGPEERRGGEEERGGFGENRPAAHPLEHLDEILSLTPEQKAKAGPIFSQARTQIEAIRQEAQNKVKALIQRTNEQLKPILNPDQQQKLDELRNRVESQMQNRPEAAAAPSREGAGGGGPRMGPLERLANELNLTDDQKAKIKPILDETMPQVRAVFQDSTLSQQEKMAKIKSLRDAGFEKVRPLLDPGQQQKLDQFHDRMNQEHPEGAPPNPE